ncbi:TenA family transcriptional regulator [Halorubrum saccharovorum DSM 1137]|uniref:TenA family transcriptional regulator n=1 Tax=Halorubrum saccharovorum DSM 1137 TaxID=1227484 RepID=M0E944_9EURY|nr:thiaminase II [Halorubrum saccharovorum]ELZ42924.1 TenA family transcriptional regulator [Halorubrum saccharovorum DSM 1137]
MAFSDDLLEAGADIWAAQFEHPFVRELAAGDLDEAAFRRWLEQDYRYLSDYARTYAVAGAKARDEAAMATLLGGADAVLNEELDLHRSFAGEYGVDPEDLSAVRKRPTCEAYTSYLVRTAHERPVPVAVAALFPCMQGYLDVADHMAEIADGEHRYTPFIETYTSDEFRAETASMRDLLDDYAASHPGHRDAMREAFLTSARLELAFWEMAYAGEEWEVETEGTVVADQA